MRTIAMILLAAGFLMTAGCAQEKKVIADPGTVAADCSRGGCPIGGSTGIPNAPAGTGEDPSQTGYSSGSTSTLTLTGGASTLAQLFYNSKPTSPTNVRINIDLNRKTDSVIVSYYQGSTFNSAAFGVVHPYNPSVSNSMYNGWVNQDGQSVWKGFFQDTYGAIVLVVDKAISTGDGQPSKFIGGSIWFQNFDKTPPRNPVQGNLKMCWEIQMGNHDCRSFLIGDYVNMISSYNPTTKGPDAVYSYQKLGEFNGISRSEAGF